MAKYPTRDGRLELEVREMDEVQAIGIKDPPESQPPDVDYIQLIVRAPETENFYLELEFWPADAIAIGKDVARQGKSAKTD